MTETKGKNLNNSHELSTAGMAKKAYLIGRIGTNIWEVYIESSLKIRCFFP